MSAPVRNKDILLAEVQGLRGSLLCNFAKIEKQLRSAIRAHTASNVGSGSLGQILKSAAAVKASPSLSKEHCIKFHKAREEVAALIEVRNDLVHASVSVEDQLVVFDLAAQDPEPNLRKARIATVAELRDFVDETRRVADRLAGALTPPAQLQPKQGAAGDP